MNIIKKGLKELPPDERDFALGTVIELPKLSELPKSFTLGESVILDQNADGNDDMCSGYSTAAGARFQDRVEMYPPFVFAASKSLTGDIEEWGQDMRSILKAWVKFGCAEEKEVPESIKNLPPRDRRYFDIYPNSLKTAAKINKKETFFAITGKYDAFDNIRASIYYFREKKQVVYIGVKFRWPLSEFILNGTGNYGLGHMMFVKGYDEDGLIAVNSVGPAAGKNGEHRITRETINYDAKKYGAMMLTDIPREEAERLIRENQGKQLSLIEKILLFLKELFSLK